MNIQRYLMFIPFCCLLYSINSISAPSYSSELSDYSMSIKKSIDFKGGGVFNKYKGKTCSVRLHISRDGAFLFSINGGYPDLCNQLSGVLNSMKKLPPPPSDGVYQVFKSAFLDFKF
ncbi:TPA: hypothetical protein G9F27_004866 [Salmonella enterica]|uniref:Cell envelope integrity protein TolA n=1 Tax=Salmonella enterica TaxID=28901 RepID=A0A743P9T4_SALER|nr:hypothetical protein [Salmonella enterica]